MIDFNFNIIDRQPVTRKMSVERNFIVDNVVMTEENENEIVATDCLACGWSNISSRMYERCQCEGKQCPHFDSSHYHLENRWRIIKC